VLTTCVTHVMPADMAIQPPHTRLPSGEIDEAHMFKN